MAWRVSREPAVSWEMERGWPLESLATRERRVSSPSAAKTGACVRRLMVVRLRILRDISLHIFQLCCPAAVIHAECFEAPVGGDFVEAGLSEKKQGAG